MKNILVFGSINMDLLVSMDRLPEVGETVIGNNFLEKPGGKGSNQAISARRFGAETIMYGRVGRDKYGQELIDNFKNNEVIVDYIKKVDEFKTGMAVINIDNNADNTIVVIPGANQAFVKEELDELAQILDQVEGVLFQFEIPHEITFAAIELAADNKVMVFLDPAPVADIPERIYKCIDVLMPNLNEARKLSGLGSEVELDELGEFFLNQGVKVVLLTLGSKGVFVKTKFDSFLMPGIEVDPVDSTGAGDCFAGAFAAYYNGSNLKKAVRLANIAAGLSTLNTGAQTSIPDYTQVVNYN